MKQHGSIYFAADPLPSPLTLGANMSKIQLFQNNVMLHIKSKRIMNAATWLQIFCKQNPDPRGQQVKIQLFQNRGWSQKVKIQLFQNMVMLHIKLKGVTNAAAW